VVDAAEHQGAQSSVEAVRIELQAHEDSGGGTDVEAIRDALRREGATLVETNPERIVVATGDGGIAPAASHACAVDVPLAVIPVGTANDFARALDIPLDTTAAVRLAVAGRRTRRVELGDIDGRPFVNVASAGLAPAAARRAAPFKKLLGPFAYGVGAMVAGALEDPIEAEVDGVFHGRAWQLTIACTGAFGGGAEIEAADPQDGQLDLVVVPDGPRLSLIRRAAGMRRGTLADQRGVVHHRREALRLRVPERTPFNVDGEVVHAGPEVELSVRGGFDVVVR
jgi:diacylglycerol kinase (ATP)